MLLSSSEFERLVLEEETKYVRHLDVEHFVLVFLVPSAEVEP